MRSGLSGLPEPGLVWPPAQNASSMAGRRVIMSQMAAPAKPPGNCSSASSATLAPKLRSEEHTSELQSLMRISYAVFCLKKKKQKHKKTNLQHRTIKSNKS